MCAFLEVLSDMVFPRFVLGGWRHSEHAQVSYLLDSLLAPGFNPYVERTGKGARVTLDVSCIVFIIDRW